MIILTGPTATGKTAGAIELARHLPVEVINGDSRLFYRGMDIGTAKPTQEEMRQVPHHLVDTLDPTEPMSLATFQDLAYTLIAAIHGRHRLPVIVGGTQQYINAVVEGWRIPRVEPQPDFRERLHREAEQHGRDHLLKRLTKLDPAAAQSTGPNLRRIVRALEVIEVTGRPMSEQQGKSEVWFAPLLLGLTMPRDQLYARVDQRVRQMIESGLVEEVRALLNQGVPPSAPSLSSIGYRQVIPLLEGTLSLAMVIERIQYDTHKLVRQQQTWLRKSSQLTAIDVSESGWFDQMLNRIQTHLAVHPIP